jgi:hypothetical protein
MSKTRASWMSTLLALLLCWSGVSTSLHAATIPAKSHLSAKAEQDCVTAAKNALGSDAVVLQCGHLTGTSSLETVAAIQLKKFGTNADGIAVSKFVVLRQDRERWIKELTADNYPPRNRVGYIGIDFIDDSDLQGRYRVSFDGVGSTQTPGFSIGVFYMSQSGHNEGVPVEIRWNPIVARFQEYTENRDPEGFQPENKNPPHVNSKNCICK